MKSLLLPLVLAPALALGAAASGVELAASTEVTAPGAPIEAVAPAMPATDVPAPLQVRVVAPAWDITVGASLRETLERWCQRAGYRLVWNVEGGYRAQGALSVNGEFQEAVSALFNAIPQDLHLRVDLTKNKLVLVTRSGQ